MIPLLCQPESLHSSCCEPLQLHVKLLEVFLKSQLTTDCVMLPVHQILLCGGSVGVFGWLAGYRKKG